MPVWRTPSSANQPIPDAPMHFESLPADLLLDIAGYLTDREQRLQLSLTSPHIYPKVIPSVYDNVKLAGSSQCLHTLAMLRDTPSLARHVQSLEIYPDHASAQESEDQTSFAAISALIVEVAPYMDALHTFVWGSCSGESSGAMWNALLQSCPKLKHLSTAMSSPSPNCDRALSAFSGLQSFTLSGHPDLPTSVSRDQSDMLIHRCPDLESLTLDCILDSDLSSANWPHLRSLNLGSNSIDSHTIASFLDRHTSIEYLSLHPSNPIDLSSLSEDALPHLKRFSGSVDQLTSLACRGPSPSQTYQATSRFSLDHPQAQFPLTHPLSRSLESLILSECIPIGQLTPFAMYSILVGMKKLTSLKVMFDADTEYDPSAVLKTIVAAQPKLENLDITFVGKESLSMVSLESFHKTISRLSSLRHLSLTVVQSPSDETTASAARRFVQTNRLLNDVRITYIPTGPTPAYSSFNDSEDIDSVYVRKARFTVDHNIHDVPVTMYAVEYSQTAASGIGPSALPAKRTCTRATHDLRAASQQQPHQARRRSESSPVRTASSPTAGLDPKFSVLSALLLMATVWGGGVAIDCL
ncbi:hypothetical protein BDY19DRAFT_989723 [Irpex rosettiformis]|uniref:Uncharacterized protein n=1 Tax=Irpex rosettiformis TaxID=378272 RepID=A0ACB8UFK4_9APHY|nr:hypothetical protein BDY19DRAFT_989723 [Irpex rosettiformis]